MAATPFGLADALRDRYRLDRELGQGGMATVYLAHDLKHERDVALKVLRPELAAVLGRERFLAEIHLTAKLDHPHILTLIDSGESGGLVDFILGNHTAIEVKAKANLPPVDLKSLKALAEEQSLKRYLCFSLEPRRRRIGEITVWPYQEFLERLWNGEFA